MQSLEDISGPFWSISPSECSRNTLTKLLASMQTSTHTIMRASTTRRTRRPCRRQCASARPCRAQRVTKPRQLAAQAKPKTHLTTKLKEGCTSASRCTPRFNPAESPPNRVPSPLVPLKQIPRVPLVRHVRELVAPAFGSNHVAASDLFSVASAYCLTMNQTSLFLARAPSRAS